MLKKKICVIFGGESTEYEISLRSAASIINELDKEKYDIMTVGITRGGKWKEYTGKVENIICDKWYDDSLKDVSVDLGGADGSLIVYENGSYRLSEEYRNEFAERLKGLSMTHLKLVSDCFYKNGYINRSLLKKVFQDMLSEKQIRGLISKMENAGIIQKDGAGKYTRCVKAPDFPSIV